MQLNDILAVFDEHTLDSFDTDNGQLKFLGTSIFQEVFAANKAWDENDFRQFGVFIGKSVWMAQQATGTIRIINEEKLKEQEELFAENMQ